MLIKWRVAALVVGAVTGAVSAVLCHVLFPSRSREGGVCRRCSRRGLRFFGRLARERFVPGSYGTIRLMGRVEGCVDGVRCAMCEVIRTRAPHGWQGSHLSASAREVAAALGGLPQEEEDEAEQNGDRGSAEVQVKSVIGRVSMFETGDMAAGWDTERVEVCLHPGLMACMHRAERGRRGPCYLARLQDAVARGRMGDARFTPPRHPRAERSATLLPRLVV